MKTLKMYKLISFMILTSMLLAAILVPQQIAQAKAQAKSDLVGLTFTNNSDSLASLRLYGNGQFYYFLVFPGQSKYFTPVRGVYDVTFFSCGLYVNKEMDLTKQTKLIVPSCGTHAYQNNKTPAGVIDGGQVIKLVKVTFDNETERYMKVILQGPANYVFTFNKDQDKTYTISKGNYTYTVYGCGGSFTGNLYAHHGKVKEFHCP